MAADSKAAYGERNNMKKAIITFQGFTESADEATGTEGLFFSVIRSFASPDITTYHPRAWTTDIEPLLKQLCRQGVRKVVLVSYSHGQAAACDFAKVSAEYGVTVDLWLACDPVYRPSWLPRSNFFQPFAFRALLKKMSIKVPSAIKRVAWCRQTVSRPNGHDLKAKSSFTEIDEPYVFNNYVHTDIDASPEWKDIVEKELKKWVNL